MYGHVNNLQERIGRVENPLKVYGEEIEWVPVDSSHIEAVAHHLSPDEDFLLVRFQNNSTYVYTGVPREVFQALVDADSVGGYLDEKIKPHYPYMRVEA